MGIKLTENHVNYSLKFLSETDEQYGQFKALAEGLSEHRKSMKAILMLGSSAKTDKLREAEAYAHADYKKHIEDLQNAIADYETLRAKRITHALKIDMYRSIMSARKQGMIV